MGVDETGGSPKDARVRPWDDSIPSEDRDIYELAGYGAGRELGLRPVLLVIDVTINFTGECSAPISESIKSWPNSCGEHAWQSLPSIAALIEAARVGGTPIVFTRGPVKKTPLTLGGWTRTHGRAAVIENDPGEAFPDPIRISGEDVVLEKLRPSAFFGTPLTSMLIELGADTVVVCGATTSGCVRATVIDAFSHGFSVSIAEEATFDRGQASRVVNLFDMDQKYGSVRRVEELVAYLAKERAK